MEPGQYSEKPLLNLSLHTTRTKTAAIPMEKTFLLSDLDRAIESLKLIQYVPSHAGDLTLMLYNSTSRRYVAPLGDIASGQEVAYREQIILQTQHCVANILKVIPLLEKDRDQLSFLYNRWNVVAVASLPPEILRTIFKFIAVVDKSLCLRQIMHICRHWRTVGINDPFLWTNIRLNLKAGRIDYLTTLLQRSSPAPLSIDLEYPFPDFTFRTDYEASSFYDDKVRPISRFARMVMTQHGRIRRLRLAGRLPPTVHTIIAHYPAKSWVALESLLINTKPGFKLDWQDLPSLEFLSIDGIARPQLQSTTWTSFIGPTIRSLRLHGVESFSFDEWFNVLPRLPALEQLDLSFRPPMGLEDFSIDRNSFIPLRLPRLRSLAMDVWCSESMLFLGCLEYPKDATTLLRVCYSISSTWYLPRLEWALDVVRSKIDNPMPSRCCITTELGRKHDNSVIALYQGGSEIPFLELSLLLGSGGLVPMMPLIARFYELSHVEVLELPLHYVGPLKDQLISMKDVREMHVPRLSVDDQEVLCSSLGHGVTFPKLERIVLELSVRTKSGSRTRQTPVTETDRDVMTVGLLNMIRTRREMGYPIREIALGRCARSETLIQRLREDVPEVLVSCADDLR
ncbi:hypothetical protein NM688_g6310 [Phlebia brevispora]|uniref:Uncharacterized protein n=1 Tax=Phlebia brevispora TaxID=194682 RepID=A0ACC1SHF1_9APHY|nr:hypothetical protein NM688_g6310 [Phlebia brevispora]